MLSKKMMDRLNKQLNLEFYSSNIYLQMCAWADSQGLEGTASFLKKQAAEEMGHMMKLFDFVNASGGMALVGQIDAPATEYKSVKEVFEKAYKHEQFVTNSIHKLAEAAMAEKDYATYNFLQWYIEEQHEEEAQFSTIMDKINLIGSDKRGLYMIDREMGQRAAERPE
jgi:ferritin